MNSMTTGGIILDIIAAIILISFVSAGMKRGGVRSVLELLSFIVTIIAVMIFKDVITEFILGLEPVAKWVDSLTEYFAGSAPSLTDMILPPGEIAESIVTVIINALGFVVTYFIVKFVLKVVLEISDILTSLPFIKSANRLIGGVIGGVKGIIVIWFVMAIMLLFAATDFYTAYSSALADSTLTKLLYNNNLLFSIFK